MTSSDQLSLSSSIYDLPVRHTAVAWWQSAIFTKKRSSTRTEQVVVKRPIRVRISLNETRFFQAIVTSSPFVTDSERKVLDIDEVLRGEKRG